MGATGDEVAGDCHRAGRVGTRIVVTSDIVTIGNLDTVVKRDASSQSHHRIHRAELDGCSAIGVAAREAVEDEVIGDGDAVAQLETCMAVGVGTCGRSNRNRAGRQTQRIHHLDVTGGDEEVTREVMVNSGIKDQATCARLREVSRTREDASGRVGRTGTDIDGDFARHRDDGTRSDGAAGRGR